MLTGLGFVFSVVVLWFFVFLGVGVWCVFLGFSFLCFSLGCFFFCFFFFPLFQLREQPIPFFGLLFTTQLHGTSYTLRSDAELSPLLDT